MPFHRTATRLHETATLCYNRRAQKALGVFEHPRADTEE